VRVVGADFRIRELVRVTAWIDGDRAVKQVRTGVRGGFVVSFPAGTGGACTITLRAAGNKGSRASLSLAHITCPPNG